MEDASGNTTTTVESLRKQLEDLGLETRGHKPELKKRLRKAKKKLSKEAVESDPDIQPDQSRSQPFDYYLFFDVEATCDEGGGFEYPNEIIEFPIVLVDGNTFEIVDEFRSYVKPTINPTLSEYCMKLTGIDQATVDASPPFTQVLDTFQEFMAKHDLFRKNKTCFATDGPFDIRDFITKQCDHSGIERPVYFKLPWVNVRKLYREFYGHKSGMNIHKMLETLGMTFDGREHSGLDDARNLYRIAHRMWQDGCVFKTNMTWIRPKRGRRRK
ncbi:ribonuclease H-like domain-containing protein [Fennellomyces sp. T-0311]|nr:ribonuclease H-like domain-containing protein [Fennellomyces sp. T-0311]